MTDLRGQLLKLDEDIRNVKKQISGMISERNMDEQKIDALQQARDLL